MILAKSIAFAVAVFFLSILAILNLELVFERSPEVVSPLTEAKPNGTSYFDMMCELYSGPGQEVQRQRYCGEDESQDVVPSEEVTPFFVWDAVSIVLTKIGLETPRVSIAMIYLLIFASTASCFYLMNKSLEVMDSILHILPYLGVIGTLLSIMGLASSDSSSLSELRTGFVQNISSAAGTTVYALIAYIVITLWPKKNLSIDAAESAPNYEGDTRRSS